jgi:hypothetical protein
VHSIVGVGMRRSFALGLWPPATRSSNRMRNTSADCAKRFYNVMAIVAAYPYTSNGVEGLKQYIDGSTLEQLSLTVVRAFQDGPYVVTQLKAHSHSIRKAIQFHILRSQNLNKGHIFS